jgi:ribulose-phosphate 3-epimerase
MVLLMTVNPGFGGQSYIDGMTEKVRQLRKMADDRGIPLDIEVDGGIDLNNIYKVTEAGANVIVAGSTVYNAPDTAKIIRSLREKAFGGKE